MPCQIAENRALYILTSAIHMPVLGVGRKAIRTKGASVDTKRALAEAYSRLRRLGIDQATLDTAFDVLRDCLEGDAVVPDKAGLDLCPDPSTVQTSTAFMNTLRMYRTWAGKPSYRTMEHRCDRRFAASTIYTALQNNELPSLEMVQAIIIACGGLDEHKSAFASAWRNLMLHWDTGQSIPQPPRRRALVAVTDPS
jgi:hypothetical protein